MDNYFVPIKSVFQNTFINVLDIDSGLEFLADDILSLLNIDNISNTQLLELVDNFSAIRSVLIDGELYEKKSLNWLALKKCFEDSNYQSQKEFSHWIRKSLKPTLALRQYEDSVEDLYGIDVLSWYFDRNNKSIESLVEVFQSKLTDYLCSCENYEIYLKLLKKQIKIPEYKILKTSDLGSRLLRQRYLESALIVLGVNNVGYFNFFDTFIYKRSNLLMAQELDIAVLFALKKGEIPYLMLEVIEGGFFLQYLLGCTLDGAIKKSISLEIKQAYLGWLYDIYLAK